MSRPDPYADWRAPVPVPDLGTRTHVAILGQLARLQWSTDRRRAYLQRQYRVGYLGQLSEAQGREFLAYLQEQQP